MDVNVYKTAGLLYIILSFPAAFPFVVYSGVRFSKKEFLNNMGFQALSVSSFR